MASPMKVDDNINLQSCLKEQLLSVIHTIMSESSSFSTDSEINTIKKE